jgi:ribosomal protein S20
MPVTKTAKRALRSSKRKGVVNKTIVSRLEIAVRIAKKTKSAKDIVSAVSFADRASKKKVIHKNKAARIKSSLSKLLPLRAQSPRGPVAKQKPAVKKAKRITNKSKTSKK